MSILYRGAFHLIHFFLPWSWFSAPASRLSKIWLRHAQTYEILAMFPIDGVIDGGANVGEFASLMRSCFPLADLVCVEPLPANAAILREAKYKVVEAALWDKETVLCLSQPLPSTTSCTVLSVKEGCPTLNVPAMRLDQISITGKHLLIKLDLQGAEEKALAGMGSLWERCLAFYLEVSFGPDGNFQHIATVMREKGFIEYATLNQFMSKGVVSEADKLWIHRDFLQKIFQK